MKLLILLVLLLFIPTHASPQKLNGSTASFSTYRLRESDLRYFGQTELNYLKDEMKARKGFVFPEGSKNVFFSHFAWYKPIPNISLSFNQTENANLILIDNKLAEITAYIATQNNTAFRCLHDIEINTIFNDRVKLYLGIQFEILDVYSFSDILGSYYLVITADPCYSANNQIVGYDKLRVINYEREGDYLLYNYELKDVLDNAINEKNIEFLPKYTFIEDLNGDGIADPIIIYRMLDELKKTSRIKIIIYSGNKIISGLRIRSSEKEKDRLIQVDPEFYTLSENIKDRVIQQIALLGYDNICILPPEWQEDMKLQKSLIW